jgi:hypothetical protein
LASPATIAQHILGRVDEVMLAELEAGFFFLNSYSKGKDFVGTAVKFFR